MISMTLTQVAEITGATLDRAPDPQALVTGPVVIWLKVQGRLGQKTPAPPRPMAEQIARLRQAVNTQ